MGFPFFYSSPNYPSPTLDETVNPFHNLVEVVSSRGHGRTFSPPPPRFASSPHSAEPSQFSGSFSGSPRFKCGTRLRRFAFIARGSSRFVAIFSPLPCFLTPITCPSFPAQGIALGFPCFSINRNNLWGTRRPFRKYLYPFVPSHYCYLWIAVSRFCQNQILVLSPRFLWVALFSCTAAFNSGGGFFPHPQVGYCVKGVSLAAFRSPICVVILSSLSEWQLLGFSGFTLLRASDRDQAARVLIFFFSFFYLGRLFFFCLFLIMLCLSMY